jgi:hypothetical protein
MNTSPEAPGRIVRTRKGRIEHQGFCVEAYRRVGAGLREYVFYIADRDRFLEELNTQVADHPRYPIEIKFYEDETWSDLQGLINDFSAALYLPTDRSKK